MAESSIGRPATPTVQPTIVVVGAATRDVAADDPRGWKLGGGVTYSAVAAARLGVCVHALIGIEDAAKNASELEVLRGAGVDVRLVPLARGPVFDNRRTPTGRQQFAIAASDPLPAAALPSDWQAPEAALLAGVAGELGEDWAAAFAPTTFVALAGQGQVRRLVPGAEVQRLPFAKGPLVMRADAIALSREDVAMGAPPLGELLRLGQQLLVTHGKRGSLVIHRTGTGVSGHFMPPLPLRKALDPTGAGDTFIAAWLAGRLLLGDGWRAQALASIMGGLATQGRSIADMPSSADAAAALRDVLLRGGSSV